MSDVYDDILTVLKVWSVNDAIAIADAIFYLASVQELLDDPA